MTFEPCIVIPIYNHEDTIAETIQALSPCKLHCFIIDDGSDDATQSRLETIARENSELTIERIANNTGKGAAVMTGLKLAFENGYSHALQIDADGQHDPSDVPRLLDTARAHPDALVAAQPVFDQSVPTSRRLSRFFTHFWVGIETFSLTPPDTMCGFRVYPLTPTVVEIIQNTKIGRRMDFDIEIMVRLLWADVPLCTLPARVHYPPGGKSHFRYFRDNLLITWMHTKLVCGSLKRLPRLLRPNLGAMERPQRHWSNSKERGAILGIRLLLGTYKLFGRKGYHLLLLPVMAYFFATGRAARTASRTFLQRAYRAGSDHPDLRNPPTLRTSFRHFLAFGESAIDTMAVWMGTLTDSDLVFEQRAEFFQAVYSGNGGVIISAHLGNMNVCRGLADRDVAARLTVLMFTEHAINFNKVLSRVDPRATDGVIFLDKINPGTAIALQRKIESGHMLVVLGDRTPISTRTHFSEAQFLGQPAPLPQGPFIIAGLLKCPVYLMFCIKIHTKYHVYWEPFEECIDLAPKTRAQSLQRCVERYTTRLEYYALKNPLQWFNFYDFWREGHT